MNNGGVVTVAYKLADSRKRYISHCTTKIHSNLARVNNLFIALMGCDIGRRNIEMIRHSLYDEIRCYIPCLVREDNVAERFLSKGNAQIVMCKLSVGGELGERKGVNVPSSSRMLDLILLAMYSNISLGTLRFSNSAFFRRIAILVS